MSRPQPIALLELQQLCGLGLGFNALALQPLGTFELEGGETMFVFAWMLETRLYTHVVGGRRIETASPTEGQGATP